MFSTSACRIYALMRQSFMIVPLLSSARSVVREISGCADVLTRVIIACGGASWGLSAISMAAILWVAYNGSSTRHWFAFVWRNGMLSLSPTRRRNPLTRRCTLRPESETPRRERVRRRPVPSKRHRNGKHAATIAWRATRKHDDCPRWDGVCGPSRGRCI